jgi:hypothetical protein
MPEDDEESFGDIMCVSKTAPSTPNLTISCDYATARRCLAVLLYLRVQQVPRGSIKDVRAQATNSWIQKWCEALVKQILREF